MSTTGLRLSGPCRNLVFHSVFSFSVFRRKTWHETIVPSMENGRQEARIVFSGYNPRVQSAGGKRKRCALRAEQGRRRPEGRPPHFFLLTSYFFLSRVTSSRCGLSAAPVPSTSRPLDWWGELSERSAAAAGRRDERRETRCGAPAAAGGRTARSGGSPPPCGGEGEKASGRAARAPARRTAGRPPAASCHLSLFTGAPSRARPPFTLRAECGGRGRPA